MGLAAEVCVRIQGDGKRVEKKETEKRERESEVRDGGELVVARVQRVGRSLARSQFRTGLVSLAANAERPQRSVRALCEISHRLYHVACAIMFQTKW